MDNDAAHHANISLRMYLTGDYINLVDHGRDYLDKPHLHFWLSAISFKILGITGFAYKFPSFLFSIAGVYAVFRLGKLFYSAEAGKLAALILASAFAFLLSLSDVRMDAILTSCIALSLWQLFELIIHKKPVAAAGAALFLALGFSTKGHIAVFVPAITVFAYIIQYKLYAQLISWKWLLMIILFFFFISPVLYCYYQQFNLHPEKIVRGRNEINGVRFILLDQVIERFTGKMEAEKNRDHFFFLHAFLPAFIPWSVLAYLAIIQNLRNIKKPAGELATSFSFLIILVLVSFSGYQLPHYLNVIFPGTAVLVAAFYYHYQHKLKWIQAIMIIQAVIVFIILAAAAFFNAWAFPAYNVWIIVGLILLLALVFYFNKSKSYSTIQKTIAMPVAAMILLFFLLNMNFYPQLLKYQAGKELANAIHGKTDPGEVYFWPGNYSSSFNFYTKTLRQEFSDSILDKQDSVWLVYDIKDEAQVLTKFKVATGSLSFVDYEITRLNMDFLNPSTREKVSTKMVLRKISR